jgi:hypothetical protein
MYENQINFRKILIRKIENHAKKLGYNICMKRKTHWEEDFKCENQ